MCKKSNSETVDLLEKILIQTAVQHTKPTKKDEAKVTLSDQKLRTAIAGRKHFRENKQYKEAAQMAKYAQKLAKKNSKDRMKQNIDHMVQKFKGLKWVQQVKKGGRSRRLHCMIYPSGKAETTPKGMANVFRKFYEDLYSCQGPPTTKDKSKTTQKPDSAAPPPLSSSSSSLSSSSSVVVVMMT